MKLVAAVKSGQLGGGNADTFMPSYIFCRYSWVLSNRYIPRTKRENDTFFLVT